MAHLTNYVNVLRSFTAAEVTKRSIRVQTWKKIQDKKCLAYRGTAFNRIPNFTGTDKAAELLIATDEFKNASKF